MLTYWFRKIWWWLNGTLVCYAQCSCLNEAYCQRRPGHWGDHKNSSGFTWS